MARTFSRYCLTCGGRSSLTATVNGHRGVLFAVRFTVLPRPEKCLRTRLARDGRDRRKPSVLTNVRARIDRMRCVVVVRGSPRDESPTVRGGPSSRGRRFIGLASRQIIFRFARFRRPVINCVRDIKRTGTVTIGCVGKPYGRPGRNG